MKKISDILKIKKPTISFELFPPKTEEGFQNLLKTIDDLAALKPDFFSCTYGAGGGNREKTFEIAQIIEQKHHIPVMAHLTCVLNTRDQIKTILDDIRQRGITNILALRGDPPKENPNWQPGPENFPFAKDLCAFIRDHSRKHFSIGVAGFPEGHFRCKDKDLDAQYLKMKIEHGADFVVTQFFFDNRDYFQYVNRLRNLDVDIPILPGIMPITNYNGILKFCGNDNITITKEVRNIFEPIKDDTGAVFQAGIHFAVSQCQKLLAGGAPGLHFFTLNKADAVKAVLDRINT